MISNNPCYGERTPRKHPPYYYIRGIVQRCGKSSIHVGDDHHAEIVQSKSHISFLSFPCYSSIPRIAQAAKNVLDNLNKGIVHCIRTKGDICTPKAPCWWQRLQRQQRVTTKKIAINWWQDLSAVGSVHQYQELMRQKWPPHYHNVNFLKWLRQPFFLMDLFSGFIPKVNQIMRNT